jgi:hypothetical protein
MPVMVPTEITKGPEVQRHTATMNLDRASIDTFDSRQRDIEIVTLR